MYLFEEHALSVVFFITELLTSIIQDIISANDVPFSMNDQFLSSLKKIQYISLWSIIVQCIMSSLLFAWVLAILMLISFLRRLILTWCLFITIYLHYFQKFIFVNGWRCGWLKCRRADTMSPLCLFFFFVWALCFFIESVWKQ